MQYESPTIASWRSPRTEIRTSSTQGRGVFATQPIPSGEIVAVKGGHIVDGRQLEALRSVVGAAELQIATDLFLVPRTPEEHDAVMMFLNHSCEPNAGVHGNVVFVAMRPIDTGEEVTIDYATIDDGDFSMECSCGKMGCRRLIHGKDWQRPELQRRYAGFFSTYLEDQIAGRSRVSDTWTPSPPRVHRRSSVQDAIATAADILVAAVDERPNSVIGWPTGRTMVPLYAELVRRHHSGDLDLSSTVGFNLDELLLPEGHPASFRRFMEDHAFSPGLLARDRCDIPRATGDPESECRRYDAALAEAGGLDLAILGLGSDGHIAYNLPGPPRARTHVVEVPPSVARPDDVDQGQLPLRAITMGIDALCGASRVLLLATGTIKARAVLALLEDPVTSEWPCSLLRGHANLDVVVDAAAAQLLTSR